jgi:cytochrome c oxidase assembly protein subunit 11
MTASYHREQDKANRTLMLKFTLVVAVMFAFGYLLVPFYEVICKLTGLRDIDAPDKITYTQIDATRTVRIELDANVNKLPWHFRPDIPIVNIHPGELINLIYEVENTADRPMTGQAILSYGPPLAGGYFKKIECFCFTKQLLGPHEKRRMPVVFVVDPKLPRDLTTVTLSYTFFEIEGNRSTEQTQSQRETPQIRSRT